MVSLEEDLDITNGRITEIEKTIAEMQHNMYILHDQLKETQKYIIRLAKNQAEISKRLSSWPFIAIEKQGDSETD